MSIIVILLLAILIAALVLMMKQKTTKGGSCCGSIDTLEPKIKPKDRNKSHYPYHYEAQIEGMVCANCARRVENAFQKNDGIMAHVSLQGKKTEVLSKQPITRDDILEMLHDTSYTLLDYREL